MTVVVVLAMVADALVRAFVRFSPEQVARLERVEGTSLGTIREPLLHVCGDRFVRSIRDPKSTKLVCLAGGGIRDGTYRSTCHAA